MVLSQKHYVQGALEELLGRCQRGKGLLQAVLSVGLHVLLVDSYVEFGYCWKCLPELPFQL